MVGSLREWTILLTSNQVLFSLVRRPYPNIVVDQFVCSLSCHANLTSKYRSTAHYLVAELPLKRTAPAFSVTLSKGSGLNFSSTRMTGRCRPAPLSSSLHARSSSFSSAAVNLLANCSSLPKLLDFTNNRVNQSSCIYTSSCRRNMESTQDIGMTLSRPLCVGTGAEGEHHPSPANPVQCISNWIHRLVPSRCVL